MDIIVLVALALVLLGIIAAAGLVVMTALSGRTRD